MSLSVHEAAQRVVADLMPIAIVVAGEAPAFADALRHAGADAEILTPGTAAGFDLAVLLAAADPSHHEGVTALVERLAAISDRLLFVPTGDQDTPPSLDAWFELFRRARLPARGGLRCRLPGPRRLPGRSQRHRGRKRACRLRRPPLPRRRAGRQHRSRGRAGSRTRHIGRPLGDQGGTRRAPGRSGRRAGARTGGLLARVAAADADLAWYIRPTQARADAARLLGARRAACWVQWVAVVSAPCAFRVPARRLPWLLAASGAQPGGRFARRAAISTPPGISRPIRELAASGADPIGALRAKRTRKPTQHRVGWACRFKPTTDMPAAKFIKQAVLF